MKQIEWELLARYKSIIVFLKKKRERELWRYSCTCWLIAYVAVCALSF